MEMLTKQFIALDSAMSTMNSQSQWLATQLAALS
jgi:flagellar capping protein FliD